MPNHLSPVGCATINPWRRRGAMRFAAALAGFLCLTLSGQRSASAQDEGYRVGLVVVTTLGVSADEAEGISGRMAKALEERLVIDTKLGTRATLTRPIAESCATDRPCIARVGAALEARELLFLAIVRIGGRLQINVTWADVASGVTEPRDPVRVDTVDDEQELFLQAATRLIPNAQRRPKARPEIIPDKKEKPTSEPLQPPGGTPPMADVSAEGAGMPPTSQRIDRVGGRHMTTGVWVFGGVSVLALAGGATFGTLALRTSGELDDAGCNQSACNEPPSRVTALRRQIDVADGLFATALIAGVVAGVLYWRSSSSSDRRVAIGATEHGWQLSLSGSF